jgi:hypothetical protein
MNPTVRLAALLGVVAVSGCSDATSPDPADIRGTVAVSASYAASDATLQRVSRAVAVALASEDARMEVRDAMRDSPWNSHKLVLHDFLASEGAQAFASRAAGAAGQTRQQFLATVASLPALDFYLPRREQRQAWSGTAGVVVGAALNVESGVIHRFDARGLPLRAASVGDAPLMALIPAESKARRQNPQPRGRGEVVEARGDGQRAESFYWIEPDGTIITADMASIRAGTDARFTMNVSGPTPGVTRIQCIGSNIRDGEAYLAGNVELELHTKFYAPDGTLAGTAVYADHEFPEPDWTGPVYECPDAPLISRVIPDQSTAKITIQIREDDCDCFGNDDDIYGTLEFRWNQRGLRVQYGSPFEFLQLQWEPIAPPAQAGVRVDAGLGVVGSSMPVYAFAVDQYGYRMPGSVSSWSTSDPSVAAVSSAGANEAALAAYEAGETEVYATIGGFTGIGHAEVWQPAGPGGCLQLPCPGSGTGP